MMETGEALSSAESAAKNNVHVEFYSTDSSHFYVCLISLPYPFPCPPPYIPGGVTAEFFGMGDGDNICHSRSRGRVQDLRHQKPTTIFDFYDDARLRDAMQFAVGNAVKR